MKKLIEIQKELKAPKGQLNKFGGYKYRSCEDILEAVKPLCIKNGVQLTVSDELVLIGERYYIKATAKVTDGTETVEVNAFAREEENKKGMDASQITGTASSYARKYALNGLFCIDDTKDADTDEFTKRTSRDAEPLATEAEKKVFMQHCEQLGVDYKAILKEVGVKGKMTAEQHAKALIILKDIEDSKK